MKIREIMQHTTANHTEPVLNRFPDCVSMQLHSDVAPPVQLPGAMELRLTIQFGAQAVKQNGRVLCGLGLRRGALQLKLSQGRMPLDQLQTVVETLEATDYRESSRSPNPTLERASPCAVATETPRQVYQIRAEGTEMEPVWWFETQSQDCLDGLSQARLGMVEVEGNPCVVEAVFAVSQQTDLQLIEPMGIWQMELSVSKQKLIAREFFQRCIAPKLQQSLSHAEYRLG
jgi:hypothetical protein